MKVPPEIEFINVKYKYTIDMLTQDGFPIYLQFFRHFAKYKKDSPIDYGVSLTEMAVMMQKKTPFLKTELLVLNFSVYFNKYLFEAFCNWLPKQVNTILQELIWLDGMTDLQVYNKIGKYISYYDSHSSRYGSGGWALLAEYRIFNVQRIHDLRHSKTTSCIRISLLPELKEKVKTFVPHPPFYHWVAQAEKPRALYYFDATNQLFTELSQISNYVLSGNLKYSSKGMPIESSFTKLAKSISINEFYPNPNAPLHRLRLDLLVGCFKYLDASFIDADIPTFLQNFLQKSDVVPQSASFMLHYLGGVQKVRWNKSGFQQLFAVFRTLPKDGWISVDNLFDYFAYRDLKIPLYEEISDQGKIQHPNLDAYYYDNPKQVNVFTAHYYVWQALLRGSVFLYASLGLMEVAYGNVDTSDLGGSYYSPYDGLSHFKLTPLGAYVLGITKTYQTPAGIEEAYSLVLSKDELQIVVKKGAESLDKLLSLFCIRISPTRYQFSDAVFLKSCQSSKDIEQKIKLFKQKVGVDLPPNWSAYFKQMLANTKMVKRNSKYVVFSLEATNNALHQLVAKDAQLKQLVHKAEGFNLVVLSDNQLKFTTRMRELGYLIE